MLCDRKTRRILVNASEIFPKTFPERVPSLADVNGRAAMAGDAVNQTRGQAEAHKQLSDGRFYKCLDHDPVKEYQQVIKSAIKQMIEANELTASAKNLVLQTPRTSCFYLLPNIHKENDLGRPIVSACNYPTDNIASYLDMVISPLCVIFKHTSRGSNSAMGTNRGRGRKCVIFRLGICQPRGLNADFHFI